jgi:hypothetical protein
LAAASPLLRELRSSILPWRISDLILTWTLPLASLVFAIKWKLVQSYCLSGIQLRWLSSNQPLRPVCSRVPRIRGRTLSDLLFTILQGDVGWNRLWLPLDLVHYRHVPYPGNLPCHEIQIPTTAIAIQIAIPNQLKRLSIRWLHPKKL